MSDAEMYEHIDMLDPSEWSHHALDALETCLGQHAYGTLQMEVSEVLGVAHRKASRRAGMLATLWWMTGWDDWPEEVV